MELDQAIEKLGQASSGTKGTIVNSLH